MEDDKFHIGKVSARSIELEMRQSYLDYAMSVIVSRALPDVRDGMKPVHRRILFSMNEAGLKHTAKYRKSAEVSGTVIAFYHPHGDQAVYDSMVRLAQPWNMRYELVDGQGNFGSIDGDGAAANRYTEARMTKIAEEILADIDKKTVPFVDNYSGTKQEPTVLPTKIPQLLLNGTVGIAVGMATNIPPHNLNEIMNATTALIDNPDVDVDGLMEYVQGPDFPTGGVIFNIKDIKEAYATGKGRIVMRAVAEIVEGKAGHQIIISEIPYQVNKAVMVEKIAELVKVKKLVGIADLRDESDRDGIRVVIDLKKDAYPKKILNQLFKLTPMQSVFHMNMLALVDGLQPKVLNLKRVLEHFINHRREVVTNRTKFELNKAEERAHILEGFKIALDNIDAVIKTIKASATKEEAHANLMKKFKLSEIQATAILEMRLQALAGLERKKVEDEYKEKMALIKELKALLADPKKIDEVIKDECKDMQDKYGDERRTQVSRKNVGDFTDMDLIPNEEVVITMTEGGYVKRQPVAEYRQQRRGGKGVIGMTTKEEDQINTIQVAMNHNDILFFTNKGRVFKQKVFEIPKASRIARGTAVVNLIQTAPDELVTAMLSLPDFDAKEMFVMVTKEGVIKKTLISAYANIRSNGLIAIKLDEGDELRWVRRAMPSDKIMIVTQNGQSILFKESDARLIGRSARGVRGMRLRKGDQVVGASVVPNKQDGNMALLVISENGLGKKTLISQYTVQKRGGIGLKTMNITTKTGKIVGSAVVYKDLKTDIIITSTGGQIIRLPLKGVSTLGRATQGVRVMKMKGSDKVASFTILVVEEADGSMTDPNEELAEGESPKVQTLPKNGSKQLAKEDLSGEDEEDRSSRAKLTTRQGKTKATPSKAAKAGFTKKKLAGKTTKDRSVKAKASPRQGKSKAPAKAKAFTTKKLVGKTTKAKVVRKPSSAKSAPGQKGFTRRKLK
ncbi:MAG: DNA gyrase subunit A [Patescibacteria group bacterium]|nr:DNA gyrase subunit A [Patescibacteria group bacterium]